MKNVTITLPYKRGFWVFIILCSGVILMGVVTNLLDCDIIVSEFELQSHTYVHFWTNTYG